MQLVLHYVGFPCFDVFLQNCTKGRYTLMSFGFNVRCCTVVESYIVYVFCTNIELFRDGHYLCRGRGGRKIGGQGSFKLAKRGAIVIFWYKDKRGNIIQQELQHKKSIQES